MSGNCHKNNAYMLWKVEKYKSHLLRSSMFCWLNNFYIKIVWNGTCVVANWTLFWKTILHILIQERYKCGPHKFNIRSFPNILLYLPRTSTFHGALHHQSVVPLGWDIFEIRQLTFQQLQSFHFLLQVLHHQKFFDHP